MGIEIKVGSRVHEKYGTGKGVVVAIWDGKYYVDYYEGEQYNPYRIMVLLDGDSEGSNFKLEHLELE